MRKIMMLFCYLLVVFLAGRAAAKDCKILYVDSYNANYWSLSIESGIREVLEKRIDTELRVFRMDTKYRKSAEARNLAALKAKEIIDEWQPDVVITSDDNAVKYLLLPYYLNSSVPFVFCGVNSDASHYGLPVENVTGMVEVNLINESLRELSKFARGNRVGFLASNSTTSHKTHRFFSEHDGVEFTKSEFVETFAELKDAYLRLQDEVDMLYLYESKVVKGFDVEEMIAFVLENAKIPSTSALYSAIEYTLLGIPKTGVEQGEWAAAAALAIYDGKKPSEIPVTANSRAKVYLNMDLARKMNIKFPLELIADAHFITSNKENVLYLDF